MIIPCQWIPILPLPHSHFHLFLPTPVYFCCAFCFLLHTQFPLPSLSLSFTCIYCLVNCSGLANRSYPPSAPISFGFRKLLLIKTKYSLEGNITASWLQDSWESTLEIQTRRFIAFHRWGYSFRIIKYDAVNWNGLLGRSLVSRVHSDHRVSWCILHIESRQLFFFFFKSLQPEAKDNFLF